MDDYNTNNSNQSNNNDNQNPSTQPQGTQDSKPGGYYGQMGNGGSSGDNNGNSFNQPSQPTPPPNKKPQKTGTRVFFGLILAVVAVCGIVIAIAFFDEDSGSDKGNGGQSTSQGGGPSIDIKPTPNGDDKDVPNEGPLTSVQVAKKVSNSVIAVLVYQDNRLVGEGSGVIMSADEKNKTTYVVTCAHIINTPGVTVRIQTKDGTKYEAAIVGFDNKTDIGVLRIAKTGFTVAEFGDSSKLQVGEQVFAIGNPGGTAFYGSFTSGVVSAIDRLTSAGESAYSMPCIQHDAAINPGNSGGALVNSYGQVIGINSSKIADTEYEGMGFAIPITVAKEIVDKIIQNGYVPNRPKLGISYSEVSYSQTYSMIVQIKGLPNGSVVIATIDENSSFKGTDVQIGDLITAVNGKKLDASSVLLDEIEKSKVGDTLTLSICRINKDYSLKEFDVKVQLIEDKGSK